MVADERRLTDETQMIPKDIDWDALLVGKPSEKVAVDRNAPTGALELVMVGEPQTLFFQMPHFGKSMDTTYSPMITTLPERANPNSEEFIFSEAAGVVPNHAKLEVTFKHKDLTHPQLSIKSIKGEVVVIRNGVEIELRKITDDIDEADSIDLARTDIVKVGNVAFHLTLQEVPLRNDGQWQLILQPVEVEN
jgi:nitrogen fixation protein